MDKRFKYRLSQRQKESVSENLVAFMGSNVALSQAAATFIGNWILSGPEEKTKAYFDVWDIVLRNYMPAPPRPVLFRSCNRIVDEKITSFTGNFQSFQRFSQEKGLLLICDTKELLPLGFPNPRPQGQYRNTYFSIAELLKKEAKSPNCHFSDRLINDYVGEDEYIVRTNLNLMSSFKWHRNKNLIDDSMDEMIKVV